MSKREGVNVWKWASLAVLAVGVALIAYMIVAEGELGALPLGMELAGAVSYVVAALKSRGPDA